MMNLRFKFTLFLIFLGIGTSFAQNLDTTSTFDESPIPLPQSLQGFAVTPKRENIEMDILDFLSYSFIGKKVTVTKNQKKVFTGMVTKVYEKSGSYYASIFDLTNNRDSIKLSFYKPNRFPDEIMDRDADYQEAKARQQLVVENKISTSELVQSAGVTVPDKSLRSPTRSIRQSLPYMDMTDNQIKNASFLIYRDALYLGNGQKILIKIEEP